ncbi:MAG: hypothetical protein EA379_12525 [Phycisphaerales bacterium]|nr:MAG: hypothetical protein EA379_12525 [Phycisphaerales bacterium]
MTIAGVQTLPVRTAPTVDDGRLVWGLDVRRLHDLHWAARGIQVVRPGQPHDPKGPAVFLFLRHDQALIAQARPWLKRLSWSGCRILRVRVVDRSGAEYTEQIVASPDNELRAINRIYPTRHGRVGRVILSTDQRAAQQWASFTPGKERWSTFSRDTQWRRRSAAWSTKGRLYDLTSERRRADLLGVLMGQWRQLGQVIPGIYQWKPGVWVHESSRIAPSTRLIGPVWIGAGCEVDQAKPVIGPLVIHDETPCRPVEDIDWEAFRLPQFPLTPRIRGGLSRRVSKRAFDIAMSMGVLAGTMPLYPFIMLAIYIEDGRPFFFAHRRQTLGGREFPCWKFRTMIKDADRLKEQLQAQNVCDGPQFFIENDPRLLRCGRLLRRLQMDELPQFWNVLRGHMSIVGPRPSPDKENQFCPAWREARLSVRPGITGLWQVRRTRLPETDFQEWIRYDLEYVQRQSWSMDIWIIIETVRRILRG